MDTYSPPSPREGFGESHPWRLGLSAQNVEDIPGDSVVGFDECRIGGKRGGTDARSDALKRTCPFDYAHRFGTGFRSDSANPEKLRVDPGFLRPFGKRDTEVVEYDFAHPATHGYGSIRREFHAVLRAESRQRVGVGELALDRRAE